VVLALVLGSVSAVVWGIASTLFALPSRSIGITRTVLWVGIGGASAGGIAAVTLEGPPRVAAGDLGWLAAAAGGILVASYTFSLLLSRSDVSLATPIVACDGAIAALAFIAAGDRLPVGVAAGLALMVLGLVIALRRPVPALGASSVARFSAPVTVLISLLSAGGYAAMLFASAHVEGLPPIWTVVFARGAVTLVTLAVCFAAGLAFTPGPRWAVGLAALTGTMDVTSFSLYLFAAEGNRAVAAVAVSQYGVVAALLGVLFLRERLGAIQAAGVGVLACGAATVVVLATELV
jgi:drug/metabolite transporter (DMT)-like permease